MADPQLQKATEAGAQQQQQQGAQQKKEYIFFHKNISF